MAADTIPSYPREYRSLTDRELVNLASTMPTLTARATQADRLKVARLTYELGLRLQRRVRVDEIGCTKDVCRYPALAGVDVSIDGDIWSNSPMDMHTRYCPFWKH